MADHHGDEPLHERTRRALQDNPDWRSDEVQLSEAPGPAPRTSDAQLAAPHSPLHMAGDQYTTDLQRRMRAIHRLREEAPLLDNCVDYHTYLTQRLATMSPDSVDYPTTLARLSEVHARLIALRSRREEDESIIRSTEYLVPLLQVPEGEITANQVKT